MASNDAELMRKMINTIEQKDNIKSQPLMEGQEVDEAFPVLKQALRSKLTGLASKFSKRMAGRNQVQKALVPYLSMFVTQMGRKNQNWDTVTWRTVLNYLISNTSLRLPLGEYEPQQLKSQDISQIITDDNSRRAIMKYLGTQGSLLNSLMPKNISSKMNMPVAGNMKGSNAIAQKLITGLFVEAIQLMFDRAQDSPQFATPHQPEPVTGQAKQMAPADTQTIPAAVTKPAASVAPLAQQLQTLASGGVPPSQLKAILDIFKGA